MSHVDINFRNRSPRKFDSIILDAVCGEFNELELKLHQFMLDSYDHVRELLPILAFDCEYSIENENGWCETISAREKASRTKCLAICIAYGREIEQEAQSFGEMIQQKDLVDSLLRSGGFTYPQFQYFAEKITTSLLNVADGDCVFTADVRDFNILQIQLLSTKLKLGVQIITRDPQSTADEEIENNLIIDVARAH